ncbi:MAG: NAD(P)-dependent oxidoreductase [Nanoarchaeota archaeon]|nr:NAD(P)-dependent oxidoreductase [Nanoarchaeota archaeon]
MNKKTILITGSSGMLGSFVAQNLKRHSLVLTDHKKLKYKSDFPFYICDLSDKKCVRKIFKENKIDCVLHFGAEVNRKAPWEKLLPINIIGLYNLFDEAYKNGCKKIIFASSINVVNGLKGKNISEEVVSFPKYKYGVSKAFGESLGAYYSQKDISFIAFRFGWIVPYEDEKHLSLKSFEDGHWPHPCVAILIDDALQIIECAIKNNKIKFGVYNALSDNKIKKLDISKAKKELGYKPRYDAIKIAQKNKISFFNFKNLF